MDKVIFFAFMILICGYLWVDNHNKKQMQEFNQKLSYHYDKAVQKDLNSQKTLADLYARGADLIFSDKNGKHLYTSAYWYEQSAIQGDVGSQFMIADIYEKGIGIEVNLQNANYWYYQASLQGDGTSQYRLTQNFENGQGVAQSYQDAMYWYTKSAEQGDKRSIYKVGVVYDDGLWGFAENNELALFWLDKLNPDDKNSPFDLRGRLLILKNPIDLSKVQIGQIQTPQTQYSNTNKHYPSEYYGHSHECTAICHDGTCSKSLGRRGVCSSHGGVKYWLK
ncbi:MAG: hypothetical protein Q4B79_03920 [Moraxella sp.]|uniref:hypothetical protein n=1 Tax=Moraxella sp. TaxID=479 RepID=UPI0026DC455D|nr:hypothetical protein [Moraxella sp.]MDO4450090.1 hypothetical protein [Moraxella sp.]